MSALAYSYPEPYKFPAGVLALVVHAVFFALLYFGVNWHSEQSPGMEVEIWESLPAPQMEQVVVEPPPVEPPKLEEPVEPPKAEIELEEKKKPKIKPPEPVPPKKAEPVKVDAAQAAKAAQAEQERAAQAAAIGKVVDEFVMRIKAKIKRNIVMPPDVQDNMQAEFDVILIPGGSVLSTRLVRPSGNAAYDEAVERAIMKAQPLPLPPDVAMFNRFRELHLTFTPKE